MGDFIYVGNIVYVYFFVVDKFGFVYFYYVFCEFLFVINIMFGDYCIFILVVWFFGLNEYFI